MSIRLNSEKFKGLAARLACLAAMARSPAAA